MEPQSLVESVQELNDVELATLLCLVAGQHCIVHTEPESLDALEQELQLVRVQSGPEGSADKDMAGGFECIWACLCCASLFREYNFGRFQQWHSSGWQEFCRRKKDTFRIRS